MLKTENRPAAADTRSLPWLQIAWFGMLLIVCYWPVLKLLVWQWGHDEDFSHGFFVPLVAGYIIWQRRDCLTGMRAGGHAWGLVLIILGAVQLWVGTLGAELFLSRTAFLVSMVGAIVYLGGIAAVRRLAFPLFLLLFMIPIPAIIYNQITLPLQFLASWMAELALGVLGIPVMREGNILELPSQTLNVVEACSGIRSLISLSFLSLVYAYFFDRKLWMRVVLLAATVPIALSANAARVTITGVLSEYNTELAKGFLHSFEGWLIFMVALALLALFHQVANRIHSHFSRGAATAADVPEQPAGEGEVTDSPASANSFRFLRGRRALILTSVLVVQAAGMHGASRTERIPAIRPLAEFPAEVGPWSLVRDMGVDQETQAVLKADDTLSRYYQRTADGQTASLFVAFFRSQRTGQTPHSPKNCLPGAGWVPADDGVVSIAVPGEAKPIRVNRYIVSKGDSKSVVLYWYQTRDRVVASEYRAKIFLVLDSIRYNRSDTAMVRVLVPVTPGRDEEAKAAAEEFVRSAFPVLRKRLPS